MTCIIPYPSVSMCDASVAGDCMRLLNDGASGIDRFVFTVGSDRSKNAVLKWLDGTTRTFARIGVHRVKDKVVNGTSAVMACLRSCIDAIEDESVLFVPPWWHLVPGSRLDVSSGAFDGSIPGDVVSIMLAGWLWSEVGPFNFVPRDCKYDEFVAVQSVQGIDKFVFNPNSPQVVNSVHFREGGVLRDCSIQAIERLCDTNYWGRDDVNMVLVPKQQKPFFRDILNTNPAYGI